MNMIISETLGEAWLKSLELVMFEGEEIYDDDRKLKEVRNVYYTIKQIEESDSILQKHADKDRINLMKEKYATCGLVGEYKIDYGSYIYDNNGVNQIDWLQKRIKNKPETKSATITLHKPGESMLACLSLLDFKFREDKLHMTVVYRSQNIFASQPGNLIALRRIQNDIANELNIEVGSIELVVISAHIYEDNYISALDILKQESLL